MLCILPKLQTLPPAILKKLLIFFDTKCKLHKSS
uniref:Uncharacterized protein n=1 Tax=Arundo donax TaxID=35708 RepID=A0A0A9FUD1_ARUDO